MIKDTKLIFSRRGRSTVDEYGSVVDKPAKYFEALGCLQPMNNGTSTIPLPEGTTSRSLFVFYTEEEIRYADQYSGTLGDETNIGGRDYLAFDVQDWTSVRGSGLRHYKVYLAMKSIPVGTV